MHDDRLVDLSDRFENLFDALGQMRDGPPTDLAGFIRDRPPVGELPPALMTFLLAAATRFIRDFGRIRFWLERKVPLAGDWGLRNDMMTRKPVITEVKLNYAGLDWTIDLAGDRRDNEPYLVQRDMWSLHSEDVQRGEFVFIAVYPVDLAELYAMNRGDALLDRLSQFPELGYDRRGGHEGGAALDRLLQACHGEKDQGWLRSLALGELVRCGLLDNHEGEDYDNAGYQYPAGEALPAYADLLAEFGVLWADPGLRPWLGSLVGDWEGAHAAAVASGLDELANSMLPRVQQCRRYRLEALRRLILLSDEPASPGTIRALLDVEVADLPGVHPSPIGVEPGAVAVPG